MKRILFLLLSVSSLTVFSQDIIVTNYSGATTFDRYEEFSPIITIQNTGIVSIDTYFYAAFYLSQDDQWDSSDVPVESISIPSGLGAGQSATGTPYRGSIDATPGTYYLIIKADHTFRIAETDETNNLFIIPNFTINPPNVDFAFTSFSLDKTSYSVSSVAKASYVLRNLGSTNTGKLVYIRLALSADNILDEHDYYFNDASQILTGPDNFTSNPNDLNLSLALPSYALGNYYVLAWVDRDQFGGEKFSETNENNNLGVFPITISAASNIDLTISTAYTSFSGGSLSAGVRVQNNGTTSVGGYNIGAQLMPQGGTPDYHYWECPYLYDNNLSGGEGKDHNGIQFYVPTPAEGTYYAVYKVNFQNSIPETSYSNNVYIDYSTPIVIGPPPVPGVTFNSLATSGAVDDTDQQVNLTFNLTNSGNTIGFNQKYTVAIKNASNATVHSQQVTVLINFSPGQSTTKAVTLNLSTPLPVGTYQVSATCTSPVYTTPTQVSNSFDVVSTQYTLTGTVKSEDGSLLTKGQLFLYQDDGNGSVVFVQKVVPYSGPTFSFSIDHLPHTLYFVPDPLVHPDHVPTIYGKTIVLQPENFFVATDNINLDMEVLKVSDQNSGSGVISGQVTSSEGNPAGRMRQLRTTTIETSSLPVVLLSSSHEPVQIVYTDADGFYEFRNLPRDTYEVFICFELDARKMNPVVVDITEKNLNVNFEMTSAGVNTSTSQLYLPQTISMSEFQPYQYGNYSIIPDAQSNAGLTIEYLSSNDNIAAIVNNEIVITGVGTAIITARQAGNNFYQSASIDLPLTINKADQSLLMSAIPTMKYGDLPYTLLGTSSSNLSVTYTSSDASIASISNNLLTIHKPGTIEIIAEQTGNDFYNPAVPIHSQLTIDKGDQLLNFSPLQDKIFGDAPFLIECSASSGLEVTFSSSNPNIASVSGTFIEIHSAGSVEIIADQPGNELHNPALPVTQQLTIEKSTQTIFFDALSDVSTDMSSFEFLGTASSGLNVHFESSDEEIVSIDGNLATIHGSGIVNVTAYQPGNQNYLPAKAVTRELRVNLVLGIEEENINKYVYPNPTNDFVYIGVPNIRKIEVADVMGRVCQNLPFADSRIDLSGLEPGVYFITLTFGNQFGTIRVVKR